MSGPARRLPRVTVDDVLAWGPCPDWTPERVRTVAGRRKRWSALDVLAFRGVSAEDKLWLLLREEMVPAAVLHGLACDFAARALRRERRAGREPDPRSWAALAVKRWWIEGAATDADLAAAGDAAGDAAWAAAGDAAWAAARAAAWAAAGDAAGAAAWNAAWDAARDAARDAERRWQVRRVRAVLTREGHR